MAQPPSPPAQPTSRSDTVPLVERSWFQSRRHSGRDARRHHQRPERPQGGDLPPIPRRLKRRIRRGEFVELHTLLHANLMKTSAQTCGHECGCSASDSADPARSLAAVTDLQSWTEAWSVFAAVLTSLYTHLAPHLFSYQYFITLKSRSFQPVAV